MKTSFGHSNQINKYTPSFQANKKNDKNIEAKKEEIEFSYGDFIANLYYLAGLNEMSENDILRQVQFAQSYRNNELGKLDILV